MEEGAAREQEWVCKTVQARQCRVGEGACERWCEAVIDLRVDWMSTNTQ